MATRSRIAIENQDGTVTSIYCHWDGYPSNNGALLLEHYSDREKTERLIALGDISYLTENLEPSGPHSFDYAEPGVVVAYHRDRGEEKRIRKDRSIESFAKSDIEEYGYLMTRDGAWIFIDGHKSGAGRTPIPLESVLG